MPDDIGGPLPDGPLLARYVSGQCTAAESAVVRAWMAANPSRAQVIAELELAWRAAARAPYEWDVDAGWRSLTAAREGSRQRPVMSLSTHRPPVRRVALGWWATAAAVLVVAGSTVAVWRTAAHGGHAPAQVAPAMTEITTQRGQRATLRLDDGTHVVLGMVSRLRIPRDFGETRRDVYLDGDGYFEVTHDTAHPFTVHTAGAIARDVGTTFGVRAYGRPAGGAATTEVAVASGSVVLTAVDPAGHAADTALVLHADDIGRIDQLGQASAVHDADVAGALAWTSGRLVFRDAPLRDVIAELGRWYDLDLEVHDSAVAARRLTASFSNESVPLVLERIALSLDLTINSHGRTIVFRPRH
jgi:transmembrane sensor